MDSERTSQNSRLNLKKSQQMYESKLQKSELPNPRDSNYLSMEKKIEDICLKKPSFNSCELNYNENEVFGTGDVKNENSVGVLESVDLIESSNIQENVITQNTTQLRQDIIAEPLSLKTNAIGNHKEEIYQEYQECEKNEDNQEEVEKKEEILKIRELNIDELKKVVRIVFKHYDWDGSGYLENEEIKQIWEDLYEGTDMTKKTDEEIEAIIEEYDTNKDGEFS